LEKLNLDEVSEFVNANIVNFHLSKLKSLQSLNLKSLLRKKNPYLFRARNLIVAAELIEEILDAFLSSSEEKLFGDFLEELAIFIASKTCNGRKSPATGIDLEFENEGIIYLVSVKSGPNWGNSAQHRKQESDFDSAVRILRQSRSRVNVQPVLGICYGKSRPKLMKNYNRMVGQSFWHLISDSENLYTDIIEPLGYRAKEHNESFHVERAKVINAFTAEFLKDFCVEGEINWRELVQFNSGNMESR
jgi:hypothetical protein